LITPVNKFFELSRDRNASYYVETLRGIINTEYSTVYTSNTATINSDYANTFIINPR